MSVALELWRVLEAWDAARHPRGPGGRFIKLPGGDRPSLADVIRGTAAGGPKRQRDGKGGMTVGDAVRAAARQSDTTGRPTQRPVAEHRAHGAHDVADEVERALADAGVSEDVRRQVAGRARAAADSHGARPDSLPEAAPLPSAAAPRARDHAVKAEALRLRAENAADSPDQVKADIRAAVDRLRDDPGDWVGLADLRDELASSGASRQQVDAALNELLDEPGVRIIPVANTKALKPRDREAAVRIGGEDNHAIQIDPRRAPKPKAAPLSIEPVKIEPGGGARGRLDRMSDEQLERGLLMHGNQSAKGKEIQAEVSRRKAAAAPAAPNVSQSGVDLSKVRGMGVFSTDPEVRAAAMAYGDKMNADRDNANARLLAEGKIGPAPSAAEVADTRAMAAKSTISASDLYRDKGQNGLAEIAAAHRAKPVRKPPASAPTKAASASAYQYQGAGTPESIAKYDAMDEGTLRGLAQQHGLISDGRTKDQLVDALADDDASRKQVLTTGMPVSEDLGTQTGSFERTEIGGWKGGSTRRPLVEPKKGLPQYGDVGNFDPAVVDAVRQLSGPGGDWVGFADLRDRMPDMTRKEQDEAIHRLILHPDISIEEETNKKSLRQRDHDAAVRIGSRDQHVIAYRPGHGYKGESAGPAKRVSAPKWSPMQAANVSARLEAAASREEARDFLKDLTAPQLRQVADLLGATVGSNYTKPKLIDRLAEIPGRRADGDAINRMARGT